MKSNSLFRRFRLGRLLVAVVIPLIGLTLLSTGMHANARGSDSPRLGESEPALKTAAVAPAASSWMPPSPAYRITVTVDGIYGLDYAYLSTRMPIDTIDPRTFRMFWMGEEMPIQVLGEADGVFNAGDVLLFFGRSIDSLYWEGLLPTNKYTAGSVYWLTYGGAAGMRAPTRDGSGAGSAAGAFPHKLHIEKQFTYLSNRPFLPNADHWFGDRIQTIGATPGRNVVNFTATNIASPPFSGTLTARLLGDADGSHHLRLFVNNHLVLDGSPSWSGFSILQTSAPVSQEFFLEGGNAITVEMISDPPKTSDRVYLDWLEITFGDTHVAESNNLDFLQNVVGASSYDLTNFGQPDIVLYDVTDPFAVTQIVSGSVTGSGPYSLSFADASTGATRYWAASSGGWRTPAAMNLVTVLASAYTPVDLLDTGSQADYIIISHGDFWAEALPLAAHRALKYKVAVVDVQRIYDQFNGGMRSAESIRDFLAYAYADWTQPAPAFTLLMGDGTSDMRNYRNATSTFVPPYLALVDPTLGETAADNRFVTIVGNDVLPDIALGRFPANTAAEAANLVAKTVNYETSCECDGWNYNLLFASDNLEGGGGNFWDFSDEIADGYADPPTNTVPLIPSVYSETKLYMGQTCDVTNPASASECRNGITETLNVTGALFLSYVGHATKQYWAAERILDQTALSTLTNDTCLPIVLPMTCFEGSFMEPGLGYSSFGEAFVRLPVHGAVASWSPTGSGLADGHDFLERGLLIALFHNNVKQLGLAINDAKRYIDSETTSGQYDDLIETFTLFGDPALEPKTDAVCSAAPTAVRVGDFRAVARPDGVALGWKTMSELDIFGFQLRRQPVTNEAAAASWTTLTATPILATYPGAPAGAAYEFVDTTANPGVSYRYDLQLIKLDGSIGSYRTIEATILLYRVHFPHFSWRS